MIKIRTTPLYQEHLKLGAKFVNFAGWEMPVYYTSIKEEHIATRTTAGLFDISHMGEIFIEGKGAFGLIQKIITNDLGLLQEGKAFYTSMCLENGGIIDDLFVYMFNREKFMLVVNAVNIDKDLKWILKQKSFFEDAIAIDKSNETAKLDLQGPRAETVLKKLTDFDLNGLKRFYFASAAVAGAPAIISRTGYTGEDGFEIYIDSKYAVSIWSKLLAAGKDIGIMPVGLGARDTLRIEAGYSLYGHELNENITPLEAGVGFVVKLDKGYFIGRQAILRMKQEGISHTVIAFEMIERGVPREGYPVYHGGKEVGYVTSGTMSPTFNKGIGMAFIMSEEAKEGNEIHINIREKPYKSVIVKRPIYAYNGKKD